MVLLQQSHLVTSKTDPFYRGQVEERARSLSCGKTRLLCAVGLQTPRCLPPSQSSRAAGRLGRAGLTRYTEYIQPTHCTPSVLPTNQKQVGSCDSSPAPAMRLIAMGAQLPSPVPRCPNLRPQDPYSRCRLLHSICLPTYTGMCKGRGNGGEGVREGFAKDLAVHYHYQATSTGGWVSIYPTWVPRLRRSPWPPLPLTLLTYLLTCNKINK